jgi:hypothetical protein
MKTHISVMASILALTSLLGTSVQAAIPDGRLFQTDRAWLERYDSTLLSSRFFSEFSRESFDNDSDVFSIENSLRWGIPVHEDLAFGFQALLPMKWASTAEEDAEGFGDLELRVGVMGRISAKMRYGLGLNAVVDTASDPLLGDSALVLRPIAGLRWDALEALTFGINVEYNFTPQEEGPDDVSALEIKFPVIFRINEKWSAFASYNSRWNLLEESDRHRVEFSTTRVFGGDNEFAWSIGGELPLGSESFDCKWKTGLTWFF